MRVERSGVKHIDGGIIDVPNIVVYGNRNIINGSNVEVHGNFNTITGSYARVWGHRNRIAGESGKLMSGSDNLLTGIWSTTHEDCTGTGNKIEWTATFPGYKTVSVHLAGPVTLGEGSAMGIGPVVVYAPPKQDKKKKKKSKKYVEGPLPSDVEHDKVPAAEEDAKTCIICLERAPCCVAYPCMHASYCVACARTLCFGESGTELYKRGKVKCAQCREKVDSIKRIFI